MINDLEIVQWDYLLDPAFQLVNTAGKPLTDGWIEVYIHGTRDKYYCASDFNGTLHPFKIPLDSLGSNIVLASPANAYDVYIYNVYGSLVMSRYNVKPGSGSGSGVIPADASYGVFGTNELPMNNTTNTGFQFTAKDIGGEDITFHEITYPYGRVDCKEGVYFYSATIEVSNTEASNESVRFQVLAGKNPNQSIYWLDFDNTYLHKQLYTICGIANFVNEDTFRINVSPYQLTNGVKASASQVAIHKLSTVVEGEGGGGGRVYGAGWGILINNNEISVDPSIIPTIEYVDASVSAVSSTLISTIESVSGNLQDQIDNIPAQVQSDWNQTDDTEVDYIKNKPDLSVFATHDEVCAVSSVLQNEIDNIDTSEYVTHTELNSTVTAVSSVLENEIQIVSAAIPDVSDFVTHDEVSAVSSNLVEYVNNSINNVSGDLVEYIDNSITEVNETINNVSGDLVQYIDNSVGAVSGDITEIINNVSAVIEGDIQIVSGVVDAVSGKVDEVSVKVDNIETQEVEFEELDVDNLATKIEIQTVSAAVDAISATMVSASGIEYGQFYSTGITTNPATMSRVKGTIAVDNGRIQLKKGSSYHVTVRGRYNQTTAANTNTAVGYIEYVSNNTINVNVDKTLTDSQYFEISYDLFNLSNDVSYLVWFTGTDGGTVNDLWIEVHSLNGIGGQGGGTGPGTEYTPGYGIQILNNVISVSGIAPQVNSDWNAVSGVAEILNKPEEQALVAGDNIDIHVSGSNVIISSTAICDITKAEVAEVSGTLQTEIEQVSASIPGAQIQSDWNQSDNTKKDYIKNKPDLSVYATNATVSSVSGILNTKIETVSAAMPDVQIQSDWTEDDNTRVDFIKNKPIEYDLIGGQNVSVTVSGTNVIIDSTAGGDVTEQELATVSGTLHTEIQSVSSAIPEEMSLVAGDNIEIQVSGASAIISSTATGDVSHAELVAVSGQLETEIQTVSAAVDNVSASMPETEEVEFEELNINNFALASSVPVIELNSNNQVTAIDGYEIAVGSASVSSNVTTEDGSFTVYPNVSGEPVTIEYPTDVSDVIPYYDIKNDSVSGAAYAYAAVNGLYSWYIGEEPANFTNSYIKLVVNEPITFTYGSSSGWNVSLFYASNNNPSSIGGPYLCNAISVPTGTLNAGTYILTANTNPAADYYGKYIQIAFFNLGSSEPTAMNLAAEAVSKITLEVCHANSNKLVVLDRYYLGNAESSTHSDACVIQTNALSKQQTVYLPSNLPTAWKENTVVNYGNSFNITDLSLGRLYIANKQQFDSSSHLINIYARLVEANTSAKIAIFQTYVPVNGRFEKWTCTSYNASPVWTTETIEIGDVTELELATVSGTLQTEINTVSADIADIDTEEVTFEEINLSNYALASAIPDVSNFVTDTEVTIEITEAVSGKQDMLTGITDVQVVTGLPASPTQDVLYLIVEA